MTFVIGSIYIGNFTNLHFVHLTPTFCPRIPPPPASDRAKKIFQALSGGVSDGRLKRALIGRINMARSTGQMFTAYDTNNYRVTVS